METRDEYYQLTDIGSDHKIIEIIFAPKLKPIANSQSRPVAITLKRIKEYSIKNNEIEEVKEEGYYNNKWKEEVKLKIVFKPERSQEGNLEIILFRILNTIVHFCNEGIRK